MKQVNVIQTLSKQNFELIFQYPYNVQRNSSEDFTLRYAQVTTTKTL